jgi:hypothetical protein
MKMLSYFLFNFLKNPSYFNASLGDTLFSFYCAYVLKHDFTVFFDYISWDENSIMETLKKEYNWELDTSSDVTWRIGDGTAAFYNYIYLTLAGFTEHDTFQIRQGFMTREEALNSIKKDNIIRYESMTEYAKTIGFDINVAINVINNAKKYYAV